MDLQFTFLGISSGVAKLFVLVSAGYLIYRLKLTDDVFLDKLGLLLVRIFFPALIVSKIISRFSFSEFSSWWVLPVSAAVFSIVGVAIGAAVSGLRKDHASAKEFVCSIGFQNSGYLPMNLILFSFAGDIADRLLIYMFLFIVGFDLLMWSLVPIFLTGDFKKRFKWTVFLNPPVIATVFSLLWVALVGKGSMPAFVMEPMAQVGQACFPLVLLTLGAYLSRYRAYRPTHKSPVILSMAIKLFCFPLLVLAGLCIIPAAMMGIDLKFFLFLEAIMPTAVSLVIIGTYTGADNRFFSSAIFYSHLFSIVTIPIWLQIFKSIFGG